MSAIAGLYRRDGAPADPADVQRMAETMAHRGPDGRGVEVMGPVGMGHLMLWTTPESLGDALPAASQSGSLLITADARIDNREELLPALGLDGPGGQGVGDSRVILAAYEEWGEDCPDRLLGDFAFAIWDSRRQALFCARDHFGVKPFYYHASDEVFAFATEEKALFALPGVPRRLNERRLADYLGSFVEDAAGTFYEDILRLPPAHTLTVRVSSLDPRRYWALDPARRVYCATDGEYAARFRALFVEAVRCRLRSALPVGSLLSGGLDSSAITCVAADLTRDEGKEPLDTFSAVFEEIKSCDEREYIDAVLEHQEGLRPAFLPADGLDPLADMGRIFRHKDEPHVGPNLSMLWSLYGMAARQGVRVILDGHDGDSTVSHGYGRLRELAYGGHWLTLARESAGASRVYSQSSLAVLWNHARAYRLMPAVAASRPLRLLYAAARRASLPFRRTRRGGRGPDDAAPRPGWGGLMADEFAARHSVGERRREAGAAGSLGARTERQEHYGVLTYAGHPLALEEMDALCAAHGMEPRFPFWDKRLVEFCLALPAEQKLSGGWSRVVMRRSLEGVLPEAVRWRRTKINFLPGFCLRLTRFNRERLDGLALHGPSALAGCVRRDALRPMYEALKSAHADLEARDVLPLWNVAVADAWLEQARLYPAGGGDEIETREGGEHNERQEAVHGP